MQGDLEDISSVRGTTSNLPVASDVLLLGLTPDCCVRFVPNSCLELPAHSPPCCHLLSNLTTLFDNSATAFVAVEAELAAPSAMDLALDASDDALST
jgi:hypothetical protein